VLALFGGLEQAKRRVKRVGEDFFPVATTPQPLTAARRLGECSDLTYVTKEDSRMLLRASTRISLCSAVVVAMVAFSIAPASAFTLSSPSLERSFPDSQIEKTYYYYHRYYHPYYHRYFHPYYHPYYHLYYHPYYHPYHHHYYHYY